MSDPKWLSRKDVEKIHTQVIEAAGGSHGLRDAGLLESAIARPLNQHAYGEEDTFQLAASYAEGIARNHAFVDGNKRTAWTAADVFLRKNGYAIQAREDDQHVNMMESLGQGKMSREDAGSYLRENSREFRREQSRSDATEQRDIAQSWAEKSGQRKNKNDSLEKKPTQTPSRGRKY
ncbi:MAG: type II toxin-antitoxin system death-on-curing family toxin [Gammaproteobacteria bacterium]|nr:type II toxin-antitoxin system death-on-curing family toxin [Gammaproteobacteria bacterium]